MTDETYRQTFEGSKSELETLLEEESKLEMRLAYVRSRMESLRKTILALSELLGEEFEPQTTGITDAIRKVLKTKAEYIVSATNVRAALQKDNFPLSEYKNALAVIHTTLKRLEDQGEVRSHDRDGKTYYQWIEREITDAEIPF